MHVCILIGWQCLIAGWGLPSSCSCGLSSPGNLGDVQEPGGHRSHLGGNSTPESHQDSGGLDMSRNKPLCCSTAEISVWFPQQHELSDTD